MSGKKVCIIGGGAAGFFAAISCKQHNADYEVSVYESSNKLLSKVKVSGGGRCNVTHACFSINSELAKHYPRGSARKRLRKRFKTVECLNPRTPLSGLNPGVWPLKQMFDNRMFPVTDDSQTIIDCLLNEARSLGVKIFKKCRVKSINKSKNGFSLAINDDTLNFDFVIVATGGSPKLDGFDWLKSLGHEIISPVPSLFT